MYKTGDSCPACMKGNLSEQIIAEDFEYKGYKLKIPDYQVFSCGNCNEEFVSNKTIRATEKVLTDFRRGIDGLLTSRDIKEIRKRVGKTQAEMAAWIEVSEKTFARYENGQVTQSKTMDTLLRIIKKYPTMMDEIKRESSYSSFGTPYTLDYKEVDTRKYKIKDKPQFKVIAMRGLENAA